MSCRLFKYIFLEQIPLHFNSRGTDIRISKLNSRIRWNARRFIFEILDERNGNCGERKAGYIVSQGALPAARIHFRPILPMQS